MSTGTPRTKEGMQISLANATAKLDKAEREIAALRKQLAEYERGDVVKANRALADRTIAAERIAREKDAEVERLKKELAETRSKLLDPDHPALKLLKEERDEARVALGESQAREAKLREDLPRIRRVLGTVHAFIATELATKRGSQTGDVFGLIDGLTSLIDAALALPADSSALRALLHRFGVSLLSKPDDGIKAHIDRSLGGTT